MTFDGNATDVNTSTKCSTNVYAPHRAVGAGNRSDGLNYNTPAEPSEKKTDDLTTVVGNNRPDTGKLPANSDTTTNSTGTAPPTTLPPCAPTSVVSYRYVLDAIRGNSARCLAVRSDMKTGKTHATAELLKEQADGHKSIIVIATSTLCVSTAARLSEKSGKDVVDYREAKSDKADAVVTTFNSLHKIEQLFESSKIHLMVFDESEQGAQFMANGTINNKGQAAKSMHRLSERAGRVLMMDAHLGVNSMAMAKAFMPSCSFEVLNNTFAPWSGWTYAVTEGKAQGVALVASALATGQKLWVTGSSAELVRTLHLGMLNNGDLDGLRVLAAYPPTTGDEPPEFAAAKSDNELFKQYDVVFSSPAGGVGLSVEGDHFDKTVCFCVRDKDTPDATATLQYPFRVRDAAQRHIDIIHVDQSGRGAPETSEEAVQDAERLSELNKSIHQSIVDDSARAQVLAIVGQIHAFYQAGIAGRRAHEFDNYLEVIHSELKAKGLKQIDAPEQGSRTDIADAIKEAKLQQADQEKQAVVDAEPIDEDRAVEIRQLQRAGLKIAAADVAALNKYNLIEAYHFSDEPPSEGQVREYLELKDAGIATGRNNIARASISSGDARKLCKAYTLGAGDDELFKRDSASMSAAKFTARWSLDRVLIRIAGIERHGDVYSFDPGRVVTDEALRRRGGWNKGNSLLAVLLKAVAAYNATKPATRVSKSKLNKEPAAVVRDLLADRFKLDTKKVYKQAAFTILPEQPAIQNLNSKLAAGSFGELKAIDRINALELLASGDVSEALCSTLELHKDDAQFIKDTLQQLSTRIQKSAVTEYLRRAIQPHNGGRLRPVALANTYLRELAEKHKKRAENTGNFSPG